MATDANLPQETKINVDVSDNLGPESTHDGYDTVAVVACIISIGIAKTYWLLRYGFSDPIGPPFRAASLALFIHTFPLAARGTVFRRRIARDDGTWWTSYSFLWIIALIVTAILGRLAPIVGFSAYPALGLIGVSAFVVVFVQWLRNARWWRSLLIIAGSGAFAFWISGVEWGRIYKNPLYLENFILNGNVHHDTMQIIGVANMLRTYGVASPGIDGLNYEPWHWGSTWFFAQCANLLNLSALDVYQLVFPVLTIPLFFCAPLAFAVAMRKRRGGPDAAVELRDDFRFWGVFLAACVGFLPLAALDAMGVWTSNLVISDSYTFGVPCALLFLGTCIAFYDSHSSRDKRARKGIADAAFVLLAIPAGIVGLGYLKSSLMILAFALAAYAFVRLELYHRRLYVGSLVISAISVYLAYHRVVLPAHNEGLSPFDFLWSFVKPAWWPFFPIVHLFWTWLYVVLRLRLEGIGTFTDLKDAVEERRILDVEAVAVVALLGLLPGLVIHIDGGSAFYFSDVQRWLSLAFLLSWLPAILRSFATDAAPPTKKTTAKRFLSRLDELPTRRVLAAFLLIPIAGSMIANGMVWPLAMIRANAETRHALYPASLRARIPLGLHGIRQLTDPELLKRGLETSPNFTVARGLQQLALLPLDVRGKTALFIPQTDSAYWTSLSRKGACTYQSFVAPALASIEMVDGMPAYGCHLSRYYGLGQYRPRTQPQTDADRQPAALCRKAMQSGMSRVIVASFNRATGTTTTSIECPAH
jgi:hypothetical protein